MARVIAQHPTDNLIEIEAELREVAGFAPLKQILEQRFVERGHLLRAFRIVQQSLEILDRVYRRGIPSLETRVKVQLERREGDLAGGVAVQRDRKQRGLEVGGFDHRLAPVAFQ